MPEPGIYLSPATSTVVAVTTDQTTGQTVVMTGSSPGLVPLSSTSTIQSGAYINLETGQTTFITPDKMPEPGIYRNPATSTVVAVTTDQTTGQTVVMTGSLPGLVPLSSTSTIQSGAYVNVDTGRTIFIASGSTPEPGAYIHPETLTLIVVTIDAATGQPVVMAGPMAASDARIGVGMKAEIKKVGVCK